MNTKIYVVGWLAGTGALCVSCTLYWCYNYWQLRKLRHKIDEEEAIYSADVSIEIINLDHALVSQKKFMKTFDSKIKMVDATHLGPKLRMHSWFRDFWAFEKLAMESYRSFVNPVHHPLITFYGSNDFHHLSLSLIRRWNRKFNLVIFDNHPDWINWYIVGLHCGCWFGQALKLPTVEKGFHFGGASGEFTDTAIYYFFPWKELKHRKLTIFPADEVFYDRWWKTVPQVPLRSKWYQTVTKERLQSLLAPYRQQLQDYPLYITLDKDVLCRGDALQNWNSGVLVREELFDIIEYLVVSSGGKLLGMDVTGDFSPVSMDGDWYRRYLHRTQHETSENDIDVQVATQKNESFNIQLIHCVEAALRASHSQ